MAERAQAKRFYVTGMVQGVGYRFFAQRAAERLGITGYVKNLRDGRVEVYAIGSAERLEELRVELQRGPHAAEVSGVTEETATIIARHIAGFSIEFDRW